MVSRRRLAIVLPVALVASTFFMAACGDDDPATPRSLQVTVEVVDAQGDPVPGLDLDTAPDSPFYGEPVARPLGAAIPVTGLGQPFPNPFYPSVRLDVTMAIAGDARLAIEDVNGAELRVLTEGPRDAGSYALVWNGRDGSGEEVPGTVYYAHLVAHDAAGDSVMADQRETLLLARLGSGGFAVGTTDAEGRIVLDDDRLFPYLHGVEPFGAYDETGTPTGTITLTPAVRFYLTDPGTGQRMHWTREVTGTTTLEFVWDPAP